MIPRTGRNTPPINNDDEFLAIGTDDTKWKGNFVLKKDLDLSDKTITPIGESLQNCFEGRFSGDRHVISNVQITSGNGKVGLFGCIDCGTVMLLGVNGDISAPSDAVGGICGYGKGASIYGCYFTGTISGYTCGGIVSFDAMSNGKGVIKDCYVSAAISATSSKGGIAASTDKKFSVTNCYYDNKCSGTELGTVLTTPEMLSSDALDKMTTTANLWVKKATDKDKLDTLVVIPVYVSLMDFLLSNTDIE